MTLRNWGLLDGRALHPGSTISEPLVFVLPPGFFSGSKTNFIVHGAPWMYKASGCSCNGRTPNVYFFGARLCFALSKGSSSWRRIERDKTVFKRRYHWSFKWVICDIEAQSIQLTHIKAPVRWLYYNAILVWIHTKNGSSLFFNS